MTRHDRLKELQDWAVGKPLTGIESKLYAEALRRYRCAEPTAESYAQAVRRLLEEARKVAPVQ